MVRGGRSKAYPTGRFRSVFPQPRILLFLPGIPGSRPRRGCSPPTVPRRSASTLARTPSPSHAVALRALRAARRGVGGPLPPTRPDLITPPLRPSFLSPASSTRRPSAQAGSTSKVRGRARARAGSLATRPSFPHDRDQVRTAGGGWSGLFHVSPSRGFRHATQQHKRHALSRCVRGRTRAAQRP